MTVNNTTTALDYTSRDFEAIRAQLVGIAKGRMPDWITVGEPGDFGTLLLESMAYVGDVLNYYVDRNASETMLGTAQLRRSMLFLADMFGYNPIGTQSASVMLKASLAEDSMDPVRIPAGTVVSASGDIAAVFTTDTDVSLMPGDVDILVSATEGTLVENYSLGYSQGTPGAIYTLPEFGINVRTVRVWTIEGGQVIEWSQLPVIADAKSTQSAFTTHVDDEGYTSIYFGDGFSGRIPQVNAELFVEYRYGIGAQANNIAPGSINAIEPNKDLPVVPIGLSLTNYGPPLGGADPESLETMRYTIPKAGQTQHRAVTLNDYTALALQIPGVGRAVAYGNVYSAITVRIANVNGVDPIEASVSLDGIKSQVATNIENKKLIGSNVFVEDVWEHDHQGWEDIIISLDVHVLSRYNRQGTVDMVRNKILELLSFGNVDFGQRITVGSVFKAAQSVDGVAWIDIKTMHTGEATTLIGDVHTSAIKLPRIRPESRALVGTSTIVTQESGLTVTGFGGLV